MRSRSPNEERTCFQEAGQYTPALDSRADVAIVYRLNETYEDRIDAWRSAGYRVHAMTGVSWGAYQDYVRGEWDGTPHYDDAQTAAGGLRLEHGFRRGYDSFYMMPSRRYAQYLAERLKSVVDSGALAIHLEEPEFWVSAGYSEGFKREWLEYYGEPWQDPATSVDARYRAEKLKQYLYTRTIEYLCRELKQYAAQKGVADFRCYVPTHSLINYAHWGIVSPESQLMPLQDCDGLVGQVWTTTSRTPTVYRGERRERTLEAGYCEYAALAALVRDTGKRLWQLADPVEDDPNYCWDDYRINWECTVTASLLVEQSERFEIMPWPHRIFQGNHPVENMKDKPLLPLYTAYIGRLEESGGPEAAAVTRQAFQIVVNSGDWKAAGQDRDSQKPQTVEDVLADLHFGDLRRLLDGLYRELNGWEDQRAAQQLRDAAAAFQFRPTDQRASIPEEYATELQVVFNALADMHWPDDTEWMHGHTGVGVAISDTLMFQRGEPFPGDPDMSSLYGLALPLIKHGFALEMAQLERICDPDYLRNIRVLLLTYEGQKPPSESIHAAIASWVKQGSHLILFGEGDAYDAVREWWNCNGADYARPQEHLCELLGLGRSPSPGRYSVGTGSVTVDPDSPARLAREPDGAERVLETLRETYRVNGSAWKTGNALVLRRGPYVIAAGMDESAPETMVLQGQYVSLYDSGLGIHTDPEMIPGTRWLLYDLSRCPSHPWVIAAAGRVRDERYDDTSLRFSVEGAADTRCAVRVRVPIEPVSVTLDGAAVVWQWDAGTHTALIQFPNRPEGVAVAVGWRQ